MTVAVINAKLRPFLEGKLPAWLEPRWFETFDEMCALAPEAEIGWFDLEMQGTMRESSLAGTQRASRMKWLNTIITGVEAYPLGLLRERGVVLTNGAGIGAVTIAEYVVLGLLSRCKGYREIVRAQDRHEWLVYPPGKRELDGSKALVVGAGEIGGAIASRLEALGVVVTKVRRHPGPGELGTEEWRPRLGEFDWVIVALPSTAETRYIIGAAELAAMNDQAVLVNVSRGTIIDQAALEAALEAGSIGGAFLDVTDPEPLPPDHRLWSFPNVEITMHLSGRALTQIFPRGAARFLDNLDRWHRGEPLRYQVDLSAGY